MIPRKLRLTGRNYGIPRTEPPVYTNAGMQILAAVVLICGSVGIVMFVAHVVRPLLRMVFPHA